MTPEVPDHRVRTPHELTRVDTDDPSECVKQMLKAARDMELESVFNILTSHDQNFFRNNINETDSTGRVSVKIIVMFFNYLNVFLPIEV